MMRGANAGCEYRKPPNPQISLSSDGKCIRAQHDAPMQHIRLRSSQQSHSCFETPVNGTTLSATSSQFITFCFIPQSLHHLPRHKMAIRAANRMELSRGELRLRRLTWTLLWVSGALCAVLHQADHSTAALVWYVCLLAGYASPSNH